MIALFTTVLVHPNISASTKSVIQDMVFNVESLKLMSEQN